ncbi:MAG: HypC/HybG/HupF family hydrogenase formation chaperone [Thermotogae bacterium]|nr:HypC/HybG/HupF family hydrogenase formation chaperone [Thermotogota bacterium]
MCLGVPGKVVEVVEDELGIRYGKVKFGGIVKDVNLSYVPEAQVGDYVVVHVGFAISRIDPEEAMRVFKFLKESGELEELDADDVGREAD